MGWFPVVAILRCDGATVVAGSRSAADELKTAAFVDDVIMTNVVCQCLECCVLSTCYDSALRAVNTCTRWAH